MNIGDIMDAANPVMPVLVVDDVACALPLASTLVEAGVPVLEVTLRTKAALDVIAEMKKVEGATVGAGTVVSLDQLDALEKVGVDFIVSPGLSLEIVSGAKERGIAILPGVATSSEIMQGLSAGLKHFKFFPASAAGGVDMLKAFSGPFQDVSFCPTGGINQSDYGEYLALPNVRCVGGSWLAPSKLVRAGEWLKIKELAMKLEGK